MFAVLAATDITEETVVTTRAERIERVVVEKPRVATFGFVEDGFCLNGMQGNPELDTKVLDFPEDAIKG